MTQTRKLWAVVMEHDRFTTLWILAPTAVRAAEKAIRFCTKDGVYHPVVREVKSHGTIDVF
jgi:hypothetical protein